MRTIPTDRQNAILYVSMVNSDKAPENGTNPTKN